jgi:signal peptidase I
VRNVLITVRGLAIAMLCLFSARAVLADHYEIPTGSMRPTVTLGDHVLVDKRAFGLRVPLTHTYLAHYARPLPGDVVVVDSPIDDKVLLKRVVGVPGQRVEVLRGWIKIDGEWAMLSRAGEGIVETLAGKVHPILLGSGGPAFAESELPEDCYLLVGDNRSDSLDGRTFGCISASAILGRATQVFMSAHRFVWRAL